MLNSAISIAREPQGCIAVSLMENMAVKLLQVKYEGNEVTKMVTIQGVCDFVEQSSKRPQKSSVVRLSRAPDRPGALTHIACHDSHAVSKEKM